MIQPQIVQYVPLLKTQKTVTEKMVWILIALVPGILVSGWFFGVSIFISLALTTVTAVLSEAFFVWMRKRSIKAALKDCSAIVTAWLISLSVIPVLPWWAFVFITVFAMLIKHLYGGLGQNPFNPAMAAVCFLLLAFPAYTNRWYQVLTQPDAMRQIEMIFEIKLPSSDSTQPEADVSDTASDTYSTATPKHESGEETADTEKKEITDESDQRNVNKSQDESEDSSEKKEALSIGSSTQADAVNSATPHIDAISSATPLSILKPSQLGSDFSKDFLKPYYLKKILMMHASLWLSIAFLVGGMVLLVKRVIHWRLPVVFLGTLAVISTVFWLANNMLYAFPLIHLVTGGSMLGAFFIITDPVTGATTPKGQWLFAIGCALLVYLIRIFGSYPDGVALAVLIMNMVAPLLDRLTQPVPFGGR